MIININQYDEAMDEDFAIKKTSVEGGYSNSEMVDVRFAHDSDERVGSW